MYLELRKTLRYGDTTRLARIEKALQIIGIVSDNWRRTLTDAQLFWESGDVRIDSTDIGMSDHFLVWLELGR